MANKRPLTTSAGTVGELLDVDALFAKDMVIGDVGTTALARLHILDKGATSNALLRLQGDDGNVEYMRINNELASNDWIMKAFDAGDVLLEDSASGKGWRMDSSGRMLHAGASLDSTTPNGRLHAFDDGMPGDTVLRLQADDFNVYILNLSNILANAFFGISISNSGRLFFDENSVFSGFVMDPRRLSVHTGIVGIPAAAFNVNQHLTAGVDPVVQFRQADVDEPFIKYIGTAASSSIVNSIVAEAEVTTATRAGFVKIEVLDEGNQITDQDYFMPIFTLT